MAEIVDFPEAARQDRLFDGAASPLTDFQMEQALLGALLCAPDTMDAVPTSFRAEHYSVALHGDIHRALAGLNGGTDPAILTISDMFSTVPNIRKYVTSIAAAVMGRSPGTVAGYAARLTNLARRRGILAIVDRARRETLDPNPAAAAEYLIGKTVSDLEMLAGDADTNSTYSLDEAIDAALEEINTAHKRGGPSGVMTGMPSVDEMLCGMVPGTLHILAGRPGMGKTSLGFQWAINRARQAREEMDRGLPPAGVFIGSLEMTAAQLATRALAAESRIDSLDLRNGRIEGRVPQLLAAQRRLRGLPLTIDDAFGQTLSVLALKARIAKRKHGLSLFMIDHLHIVRGEAADARQGRVVEVGAISGEAKLVAKAMGVPVLLLAQISRETERRDDHRPTLADLGWSGAIEQNADTVSFVYRPVVYLGNEAPEKRTGQSDEAHQKAVNDWHSQRDALAGRAEFICVKARDGKPGTRFLGFDDATTSFTDPTISTVSRFDA